MSLVYRSRKTPGGRLSTMDVQPFPYLLRV